MSSLGFCNLDEAFNYSNLNTKKSKRSKKKQNEKLNGMPGTIDSTFIDSDNLAPNRISGTASTIAASVPVSNAEFETTNEFNKVRKDSILLSGESIDNVSTNKEILSLNKQIENLTDLVNEMSKQNKNNNNNLNNNNNNLHNNNLHNNNIIETFTNKPLFKFDNHQLNELLLFIFTGIFILLLFDYIYKLGKKSY